MVLRQSKSPSSYDIVFSFFEELVDSPLHVRISNLFTLIDEKEIGYLSKHGVYVLLRSLYWQELCFIRLHRFVSPTRYTLFHQFNGNHIVKPFTSLRMR